MQTQNPTTKNNCLKNSLIGVDTFCVINLLSLSVFLWVTKLSKKYSKEESRYESFHFILTLECTCVFIVDLCLYIFNMITQYALKYRYLFYVKLGLLFFSFPMVMFFSMHFFFIHFLR